MRVFPPLFLVAVALVFTVPLHGAEGPANTLTPAETKDGWQLLWDGQTLHGWRGAKGIAFPAAQWEIKDGTLNVVPNTAAKPGSGDIMTAKYYTYFELKIDFRITPGADSGIKYMVDPDSNPDEAIGLEYQLIDDAAHPDAKLGKNGDRTCASLYDFIPAAKEKKLNPPGEWNTAHIVVRGPYVEHWLNGELVLAYTRFTPEFRRLALLSKFKPWAAFADAHDGPILLQAGGQAVAFRNIKIRVLTY